MADKVQTGIDAISNDAEGDDRLTQEQMHQLSKRFDDFELAMERLGKNTFLVESLNSYVSDLRTEIESIRKIRFYSTWGALFFVLFLTGLVVCLLFFHKYLFFVQGQYFKGAVFVSSIVSCVVLISLVLKGAFRTISDRHADDPLPNNVKEMLSALKDMEPK